MPSSQRTTQLVANIILRIKRNEFRKGKLKFLVFTGTVGKTTIRDVVAFVLKQMGHTVKSNNLAYSNEIGVLLTALGISKFSAKNPYDWFRILRARINHENYACIELGADFYHDIPWFLKHFVPFAVFIGGVAEKDWADMVEKTFHDRKRLMESVPKNGLVVYNLDDEPTERLIGAAKIQAHKVSFSLENKNSVVYVKRWSKNIFSFPITEALHKEEFVEVIIDSHSHKITLNRSIFEPQLYALLAAMGFSAALNHNQISEGLFKNYEFTPQRLQFSRAKNNAIILEDSYKATPLCTFWLLKAVTNLKAQKKILIITEMRPLNINSKYFYDKLANMLRFADSVYFLGPYDHWRQISGINKNVKHITIADYPEVAENILKQTDQKSLILLKGSFRYQLEKLKQLLL